MSGHGYETGRLNLPFVGLCSFGKYPYQPDWSSIDADFAILGAPFDFGTQFRAGARFGPRGIREASTLFSFGHAGAYDHEDDVTYLQADQVRIVDIGDADIIHTDTIKSHAILKRGFVPFLPLAQCRWFLAAIIRSIFPVSMPLTVKSRFILCKLTRILISLTNGMGSNMDMAIRCAVLLKSPM